MTCQHCQDEATVHLTETVEGRRRELHLCEACAR
jgi:protein arginine kinase activator